MVEVTQEDRDLLGQIYGGSFKFKPNREKLVLQEIAAHRIAAEKVCDVALATAYQCGYEAGEDRAEKAVMDRLRDLPEKITVMFGDHAILAMDIHEEDPRLTQICDEVRATLADALERGEHKGTDNAND